MLYSMKEIVYQVMAYLGMAWLLRHDRRIPQPGEP